MSLAQLAAACSVPVAVAESRAEALQAVGLVDAPPWDGLDGFTAELHPQGEGTARLVACCLLLQLEAAKWTAASAAAANFAQSTKGGPPPVDSDDSSDSDDGEEDARAVAMVANICSCHQASLDLDVTADSDLWPSLASNLQSADTAQFDQAKLAAERSIATRRKVLEAVQMPTTVSEHAEEMAMIDTVRRVELSILEAACAMIQVSCKPDAWV